MNGARIVSRDEVKRWERRAAARRWFTSITFGNVLSLSLSIVALVVAVAK